MALPFHKLLAALGGGGVSSQITALLNAYGAVMYIPGVGSYEGNYVASAGTPPLASANDYIGNVQSASAAINPAVQATAGFKPQLLNNSGSYSWKFDGTDDRLIPTSSPITSDTSHFLIMCMQLPSAAIAISAPFAVVDSGGALATTACRVYKNTGANIAAMWRDATSTLNQLDASRTLSERITFTAKLSGGTYALKVRGDVGTPTTVSMTRTTAAMTLNFSSIGCYVYNGTPSQFYTEKIYGVIAGNGAPTLTELTALEDYLAALAGFTPVT